AAVGSQPHISWLQVPMNDLLRVRVVQTLAHLVRDAQRIGQRHTMLWRLLDQPFHVATAHELRHDKRLPVVLAEVEYGHDVWVRPQATHGLGLAPDALATDVV